MAQLADVLTAAALRHGLHATLSVEEAAADLSRQASGDRDAISQALTRIAFTLSSRPSTAGEYARAALDRAALLTPGELRRDSEVLLRKVVDAAPAMLAYWDADRCNVAGNAAYVDWFGMSPHEMQGVPMREVLGEEVYEGNLPHIDAVLAGALQRFSRTLVDARGDIHLVQAVYTPDVVGGRVVGFSVLVTDVTPFAATGPTPVANRADHAIGSRPVRVVVIETDVVTRVGLARILASAPEIKVVTEAARVEDALAAVTEAEPDVIVIDARAPGMTALMRARKEFSSQGSSFPEVVALTSSEVDQYLLDPVASTVLRRPERPEQLVDGVIAAARLGATRNGRRSTKPDARWSLTRREREVLDLALRGYSNADIGRHLFVSVDTVKTHLRNLYTKLGFRSRRELIAAAYNEGHEGQR
ncbi:MAG TPA: LuxR C-terminal-related transcriptional regulator [Acidimicrobiales bacterium]|nr:LuxR C-terminal-related transcriptional regulator [Acidimicrobiales bacterium]